MRRFGLVFVGLMLAALIFAATSAAADAASYPDRPVHLVVGFGAGGPTDIPARFIADRLGTALGQRVLVENKPASGGIVATRDVIAKPADGYTLLLCTHFEAINIAVYEEPGFKLADLAPISLIAKYYYGLALANAVPATDFKGFVAYAKAHPGDINSATVGAGSAQQILARQLQKLTGIKMVEVPFQGGAGPVQEVVAGRVQFYVSPTLAILPQYKARQLKIIAVTAPERLQALPEIPTLKETGIDFVRFGWLGVCAPAGTPAPVVTLLNREIGKAVQSDDYRALIGNAGSIPAASTPAELGQIMEQTYAQVAPTIREFGLQRH